MKHILKSKHLKTNPFVTPENYFENFSNEVMKKAGISKSTKIIKINTKRISIAPIYYSAAASILLILVSGWYLYNSNQVNNINDKYYTSILNSIGEYSDNTLAVYLDDNLTQEIDKESENLLYELEEYSILEPESATLK